jgi:hypothetical protein
MAAESPVLSSAQPKRRTWRILGVMFASVLILYVATYLALSAQGRYEAVVWGLNHVKIRRWVPKGFESNGDWNVGMICAFFPLYYLDHACWHTPGEAKSGRFPVNEDDYHMYPKP